MRTVFFLIAVGVLSSCAPTRTPVPLGEIPPARPTTVADEQYGHQVLNQLLERWRLDYSHPKLGKVQEIVERITRAAEGGKDPWHVYLLSDPQFKNAAATRGNHVFVWTGILESTRSDAEIATILAHEISHVLAGHTEPDPNEEIRKILISVGAYAAGAAVAGATRSPSMAQVAGSLTSGVTEQIGSGLLVYPYSRELEHEADRIGLVLMGTAGYDPREAIEFWTRAGADPDFAQSIPFLSTHPPAADRLEKLKEALPVALARFRGEPVPQQFAQERGAESAPVDSFDLNQVPEYRQQLKPELPTPQKDTKDRTKDQSWRVISPRAILFEAPNPASRGVGEFRQGARVQATRDLGAWIEISAPDHGYLEKSLLEPIP